MSPILGIWASQNYARSSFESIATVTVGSGGAANVEFTSIPSTYTHLQLRCFARGTVSSASVGTKIQFNNDTGSNYSIHQLLGNGSSASAYGSATESSIDFTSFPAASSTASVFGVAVVDILDYTSTNKYKTVRSLNGYDANGSGNSTLYSGLWRNTSIAAITSIKIFPSSSNLAQYSHFALYGIKGA